jgi:hypothetical protein
MAALIHSKYALPGQCAELSTSSLTSSGALSHAWQPLVGCTSRPVLVSTAGSHSAVLASLSMRRWAAAGQPSLCALRFTQSGTAASRYSCTLPYKHLASSWNSFLHLIRPSTRRASMSRLDASAATAPAAAETCETRRIVRWRFPSEPAHHPEPKQQWNENAEQGVRR